jgi:hypothetical protein
MSSVACSQRRDLQVGHAHRRLGHACWRPLAEKMQSSLTQCTRQSRHWSFENRPLHCTHCWWEQIWVESGSPVAIVADLLAWFVAYRGRSLSDGKANQSSQVIHAGDLELDYRHSGCDWRYMHSRWGLHIPAHGGQNRARR